MNELMMVLNYYYLQMCVSLSLMLFTLFIYDASSGLFTLSTLLPELVSLFLKIDKIDFDMSELKSLLH